MSVAGTLTVGGASAVAAAPTAAGNVVFTTNGTTWSSTAKIVLGTAVASTSGTSIDFTGIPSWAKRVTVMFSGVSTSGSSVLQVQVGSGSVTTSGYIAAGSDMAGAVGTTSITTGIPLSNSGSAAYVYYGSMIFFTLGSNIWSATGSSNQGSGRMSVSAGGITLSGALDRVRITTVNGTDTLDAGTINIMYE
jgi:hypothetical protein